MRAALLCLVTILLVGPAAALEPPLPAGEMTDEIARGRYLATAGDCIACHTEHDGGIPFAGGRAVPTPFGTLYTPNLTPDPETGIGDWSDEEWLDAVRHGVRPDGAQLYPALPYAWFAKVRDADLLAIKTYLMSLEPVEKARPERDLIFPLGFRPLVYGWKLLFFDDGPFVPDPNKSERWNRGAYLVEGLGHCGACHSPKNFAGAATDELAERYSGSELQNWHAPDLGPDPRTGLGAWSEDDIVQYLKTGTNGRQFAGGLMREVVEYSTQWLTDEDLHAIATYLKDLPGKAAPAGAAAVPPPEPRTRVGAETVAETDDPGAVLYRDNCVGCHRWDGGGIADVFPTLAGSPIVVADDATSLIHVVLAGGDEASTRSRPTLINMPGFGWKFDDTEVAAVVDYIRSSWGNDAGAVEAERVAELRAVLLDSAK